MKPFLAVFVCFCLAFSLCACEGLVPSQTPAESPAASSRQLTITDEDRQTEIGPTACRIVFGEQGAAADGGSHVQVDGGVVRITGPGQYVLEGACENGRVLVDAGKDDLVQLFLNGLSLQSADGPCIWASRVEKMVVTLCEGTENTLTDGSAYANADAEDAPTAALFCQDDMTLNGEGVLNVQGNFKNGIASKDDLLILSGSYTVSAANDAVRGRDSLSVAGGSFTLEAVDDCLVSNNDEDANKGWVLLTGGTFDLTAGSDAVQAETTLDISGGEFRIVSGGGAAAGEAAANDSSSRKGLKAGGDLTIEGGRFALDCADDALHAGGGVTLGGGELEVATGDDAVHADGTLAIRGGTLNVTSSHEGLEGCDVHIEGGQIELNARDDGINAAGGSDGEDAWSGPFGGDRFAAGDHSIVISGGELTIVTDGDGLDSNGNIEMSGGSVTIHGPTTGGNGSLDFGGSFLLSGGTLAAAGSGDMLMAPDEGSAQATLVVYATTSFPAGETVTLADDQGQSLLSMETRVVSQALILSAPGMKEGAVCTLNIGQKQLELTLTGAVSAFDETGAETEIRGMGGFGKGGFGGFGDGGFGEGGFGGRGPGGRGDGGARPGMPQQPDGDAPSDLPQLPDGEAPALPSDMPQPPDGEAPAQPSGMPQPPEGDAPAAPSDMPQAPQGEAPAQPSGGTPQPPDGSAPATPSPAP